jgi:hypothetical protein
MGGKMSRQSKYNREQAEKYGWSPEWFGCTDFNEELTEAIKRFQSRNRLSSDGMCGPSTYRKKFAEIEESGEFILSHSIISGDKYIVYNGEATEIFWPKVKLWTEDSYFEAKSYRDRGGLAPRAPNMFVTHWDVCLSSSSCQKVLNNRGLSVHFLIDNDGTIIQTLDMQHVAFHAGNVNSKSIGVEVSTAYDMKWQNWYERKGFGPRPVITGARCHNNELPSFLGFYDVQVSALAALWEAVSWATGIPLELPEEKDSVDMLARSGTLKGFANHYHITSRKIDCAGLDNEKVLRMALDIRRNSRK